MKTGIYRAKKARPAAAAAGALWLFLGAAVFGDGGPDGREREAARFAAVRAALRSGGAEFTERPLMADYGVFGVSLRAAPASGGAKERGGLMIAVPLLSSAEQERESIPPLSFAQEAALALLRSTSGAAFEVFFLADQWTGESVCPEAAGAAWRDMLGDAAEQFVLFLNMDEAPGSLLLYTGGGVSRVPLAALKAAAAVLRERDISFSAPAQDAGSRALFKAYGGLFFETDGALFPVAGRPPVPGMTALLSPEDIAAFVEEAAPGLARFSGGLWEDDVNYRAVNIFRRTFFVPEAVLLAVLGGAVSAALFIFLRLWQKTRKKRHLISAAACTALAAFALIPAGTLSFFRFPPAPESFKAEEPPAPAQLLSAALKSAPLLARNNITLTIHTSVRAVHIAVFFQSEEKGFYVYDSSLPFKLVPGGVAFITGNYPPVSPVFEIALPAGIRGVFRLRAIFPGGRVEEALLPL